MQTKRGLLNNRLLLCAFKDNMLTPGDYTFEFNLQVPLELADETRLPGTFYYRKDVPQVGRVKLRTSYKLSAKLEDANEGGGGLDNA